MAKTAPDDNDQSQTRGGGFLPTEKTAPYVPQGHAQSSQRRRGTAGVSALAPMPLEVLKMSDVKPEKVDWLWPCRIPRGMLTMLDGDPGLGKSTLVCEIAACVSTGRLLPGHTQPVQTTVLLINAEDVAACTVRPRLDAAGADTARVLTLADPLVSIPHCLSQIELTIEKEGVGLIVFDPLMAFLAEGIDSHRDQDVRRALTPLAAMAARRNVAVLLVRHLNKAIGGPALHRGGGSIGIVAAARGGLLLGRDPDDPELRILASQKQNLSPKARSLRFALVSSGDVARIEWRGECDIDADRLCAPPESEESRSALEEACAFLQSYLADGPKPQAEVTSASQEHRIKFGTLTRAKQKLKVRSEKGNGAQAGWLWSLPAAPVAQVARLASLARLTPASDGGNP